jgi:hypothetical protein
MSKFEGTVKKVAQLLPTTGGYLYLLLKIDDKWNLVGFGLMHNKRYPVIEEDMTLETGKYYKHKKGLIVKVLGTDARGFLDIRYADGKKGKLIPEAPGWEEITEKEWKEVEVIVEEDTGEC